MLIIHRPRASDTCSRFKMSAPSPPLTSPVPPPAAPSPPPPASRDKPNGLKNPGEYEEIGKKIKG